MNHVTDEARDTAAASVQGKGQDCIVERATTNCKGKEPHDRSENPKEKSSLLESPVDIDSNLRGWWNVGLRLEIDEEKRHNYDIPLDNIGILCRRSDAGEIFPSTLTEVAHIRVSISIYGPFFQTLRTAFPRTDFPPVRVSFFFLFFFYMERE